MAAGRGTARVVRWREASDEELRSVLGGRGFWDTVKAVGRWIKEHVTRGPGDKGIAIKGTHDIGGGGR